MCWLLDVFSDVFMAGDKEDEGSEVGRLLLLPVGSSREYRSFLNWTSTNGKC